ncbi:MAG: hypothetical protein GKS02_10320 [Alphaproteobacteria bacterium]|nr:hypothetical protein [Alphaproteobacteria bacterium]
MGMKRNIFDGCAIAGLGFLALVSVGSGHAVAMAPGGGGNPNLGVVDCASGDSIADALTAGATVITVTGTCNESVVISQSGVVLNGSSAAILNADGTGPAITVTGDNVSIEAWAAINGGGDHGIVVRASGSALVQDVILITGDDSVQVIESAFAEVINSAMDGSTSDGLTVATSASARISNSTMSNNGRHGALAASGGSIVFAGGNTIASNASSGLFASGGQAAFVLENGADTVENNTNFDINCFAPSRILVFQSVASSTNDIALNDCRLIEGNGAPVFVGHPLNLVDCTAMPPDTVARAISNGVTNVIIRGTCNESVDVQASNITIRGETTGGAPQDGLDATGLNSGWGLRVRGEQDVILVDLKITGGRNGLTVFAGGTVFATNIDVIGDAGGDRGVIVADNSFLNLRDSVVGAGNFGAAGAIRQSSLRVFNSTIDAGVGGVAAVTTDSTLYSYGSRFTGTVQTFSNSRFFVGETFIGEVFGPTVVDTVNLNNCSSFSNVLVTSIGHLVDGGGFALTQAGDFSAFNCQLNNIAP